MAMMQIWGVGMMINMTKMTMMCNDNNHGVMRNDGDADDTVLMIT